MISALNVLNTVTTLGADVSVGSDGMVNFCGLVDFDASNVQRVIINTSVAEVQGVITVTPTAYDSTTYNFNIVGTSKATGVAKTMIVNYTSGVGATATTICNALRTIINADSDFSVAATGTATLILTSAAGYNVDFTVGGTSNSLTSVGGASSVTIYPNMLATNGTAGVSPVGTVSQLQSKYAYVSNANALGYTTLSTLSSSYYYTEVIITYNDFTKTASSAFTKTVASKEAVLLVQWGTTAQGSNAASQASTLNYTDLLGTYGTITGLASGYRVVITSPATTTAAVSATGAIALSGGAATFASLNAQSGDYIAIGASLTANTLDVVKIIGITGAAAGFANILTAVSANVFKFATWRNIPL